MTTPAEGLDLAKRLRALAVDCENTDGWEGAVGDVREAAAFIERSCNTGQGVGERPESVAAAFAVFNGKPDTGPHATAMFRYIEQLEATLAARIPEASVEQAGRSSVEPVALPPIGNLVHNYKSAFGQYMEKVARGDIPRPEKPPFDVGWHATAHALSVVLSSLAPPAGRQEAVALKALHCATEGCAGLATEYFERGGVGSHYCRECYASITARLSPSGADLGGEVERCPVEKAAADARKLYEAEFCGAPNGDDITRRTPSEGGDGAIREALEKAIADYSRPNMDCYINRAVVVALKHALEHAAAMALPAAAGWQTMESAPRDETCLFWLDWADDCKHLNPPLTDPDLAIFVGKRGHWASIYKGVYWQPKPPLPASPTSKTGGDPASTGAGDD